MIDPKVVAETREEYIAVLEESLRDLMNQVDTHFSSHESGEMHSELKVAFYRAMDLCSAPMTEPKDQRESK